MVVDLCKIQTIDETLTATHKPIGSLKILLHVVRVGSGSTQDTVIPFSAVLDRVDVKVVLSNAISVTM